MANEKGQKMNGQRIVDAVERLRDVVPDQIVHIGITVNKDGHEGYMAVISPAAAREISTDMWNDPVTAAEQALALWELSRDAEISRITEELCRLAGELTTKMNATAEVKP